MNSGVQRDDERPEDVAEHRATAQDDPHHDAEDRADPEPVEHRHHGRLDALEQHALFDPADQRRPDLGRFTYVEAVDQHARFGRRVA